MTAFVLARCSARRLPHPYEWLLLVMLQLGDVGTTFVAISHGAQEGNPFGPQGATLSHVVFALVGKAIVTTGIVLVRLPWLVWSCIALMVFVVAWNSGHMY